MFNQFEISKKIQQLVSEYNKTDVVSEKLNLLNKLIKLDPNNHFFNYFLAKIYYNNLNDKRCVEYFDKAIILNQKEDYSYYLDASVACLYFLEFEKCLKYFNKALHCLQSKENSYTDRYLISFNANIVKNVINRDFVEKPKDKSKKIAICFSGRLTSKEFDSFKEKIIDNYDKVDIFVHTWYSNDIDYSFLEKIKVKDYLIEKFSNEKFEKTSLFLKSKIKEIRPSLNNMTMDEFYEINRFFENDAPMFYGINKSFELKRKYEEENNFKYDVVIRARWDVNVVNHLNLDNFELEKNTIYLPVLTKYEADEKRNKCISHIDQQHCSAYCLPTPFKSDKIYNNPVDNAIRNVCQINNLVYYDWWLTDIFLFGDSETMDNFSMIYNYLHSDILNIYPIPEALMHCYIDHKKIKVKNVHNCSFLLVKKH